MTKKPVIRPDELLEFSTISKPVSYDAKDVSLYALGIGAPQDGLDNDELRYIYEDHQDGMKVLPTFGVMFPILTGARLSMPGLHYDPQNGLHGEEYLELLRPIPPNATISTVERVKGVYDKGTGAVIHTESTSSDEQGELARHESLLFFRGLGGWGGERGTRGIQYSPPDRPPDAIQTEIIANNQHLIYRLSGELNALHINPNIARAGNFDRPILHGLCTYGFASRALIREYGDNDSDCYKSMRARFVNPVYPGETLITRMWRIDDQQIIFQCKVAERNLVVLTNGSFNLR